jgi:hypothetical protein
VVFKRLSGAQLSPELPAQLEVAQTKVAPVGCYQQLVQLQRPDTPAASGTQNTAVGDYDSSDGNSGRSRKIVTNGVKSIVVSTQPPLYGTRTLLQRE